MRHPVTLLALLLLALPAFAQQGPGSRQIHVTDDINRHPASVAALEQYRQLKAAGLLEAFSKNAPTDEVGDTRVFKVYNIEETTPDSLVLDDIEFTLKSTDARFQIWVETAELDSGYVSDADVEVFRQRLAESTPTRSVDPDAGIIVNNEKVFGSPPDVDRNGKSDVLLVDVRDGWEPGGGFVGGFVWGGDMSPTVGNGRDIVYIDTRPQLYNNGEPRGTFGAEGTLAHEYQHLIHNNYDVRELTFVNEGLSEWAEIVNGYFNRTIDYLDEADEHNTYFYEWRSGDDVLNDYERAGLFTTYLAQRIGAAAGGDAMARAQAAGAIVQARTSPSSVLYSTGSKGYQLVLDDYDLGLADMLVDFHTANLLNQFDYDARFGYDLQPRQNHHAAFSVDEVDGAQETSTELSGVLSSGAVQYYSWTDVSNFDLRVDTTLRNGQLPDRDRIRVRAVGTRPGGEVTVTDLAAGSEMQRLEGEYEQLTVLLAHVVPDEAPADPEEDNAVEFDLAASWGGEPTGTAVGDDGELPATVTLSPNFPNPFNPSTTIRFTLPQAQPVRLAVYDVLGRQVALLVDGMRTAGAHEVQLDASAWTSGLYLYRLETGDFESTRSMLLLK